MPRNGSGGYSAPTNSWNPATVGNSATPPDFNALLSDIATAISQSIAADGQTPITANIPMGGNKLTGLAQGVASGDSLAWEQLFSQGVETDVASAATCDIGIVNSAFVRITGTTTITSFGTNYRGPRFIRFGGVLQLTHNASALILPGGSNITTTPGDCAIVAPIGSPVSGWAVIAFQPASGFVSLAGNQTIAGFKTFSLAPASSVAASASNELTRLGDVQAAINAAINSAVPVGTISPQARLTAASRWLLIDGKTIGSASSGATARANADTWLLYEQMWAWPAASVPIFDSAGAASTRGASALADFNANKRLSLYTPNGGAFLRMWAPGQTVDAGRVVGTVQGDAMRNLTGSFGYHVFSDFGSGVFASAGDNRRSGTGYDDGSAGATTTFDASRQVPVAGEFRPYNLAVPHYIFLGL